MRTLVIGTRGSSLSLCQTGMVRVKLEDRYPNYRFTLRTIKATADQNPDAPLVAMGGEGIFVKELEHALLTREADLAVHSLKDLPLRLPDGIRIAAVSEREDARDAFVSRTQQGFRQLPTGARVGTSSLRRQSQLLAQRPDLEVAEIRGNVDSRLRKLDEGRYDAVVVAACGLIRLGLKARITEYLSLSVMLPEPGQGALAIEAREEDTEVLELLAGLNDAVTQRCVTAERAFLAALGGGCRVPIAAYAQADDRQLRLEGAVIAADGSRVLRDHAIGSCDAPEALGESLAARLIANGALEILRP